VLSDLDIAKKRVDEASAEIRQNVIRTKANGGTPTLPTFEGAFGRILGSAKKDPRIDSRDQGLLKTYTEEKYRALATEFGYSDGVVKDASVMRGLLVHIAVEVVSGVVTQVRAFSDERVALGTISDLLRSNGIAVTAQDLNLWHAQPKGANGEPTTAHPLEGTKFKGTRVHSLPIG